MLSSSTPFAVAPWRFARWTISDACRGRSTRHERFCAPIEAIATKSSSCMIAATERHPVGRSRRSPETAPPQAQELEAKKARLDLPSGPSQQVRDSGGFMLEFRDVLCDSLMRVSVKVKALSDGPRFTVRSDQGKAKDQAAGNAVTSVRKDTCSQPVFEWRGRGNGPYGHHDGLGGGPRRRGTTDPQSLVKAPTDGGLEDFPIPVRFRNDLESRLVSNSGIL